MESSDSSGSDDSWQDSDDSRKDTDFVPDSTDGGTGKNTMSTFYVLSCIRLNV